MNNSVSCIERAEILSTLETFKLNAQADLSALGTRRGFYADNKADRDYRKILARLSYYTNAINALNALSLKQGSCVYVRRSVKVEDSYAIVVYRLRVKDKYWLIERKRDKTWLRGSLSFDDLLSLILGAVTFQAGYRHIRRFDRAKLIYTRLLRGKRGKRLLDHSPELASGFVISEMGGLIQSWLDRKKIGSIQHVRALTDDEKIALGTRKKRKTAGFRLPNLTNRNRSPIIRKQVLSANTLKTRLTSASNALHKYNTSMEF